MNQNLTASVLPEREWDGYFEDWVVTGYRWILYATNGAPLAQQAKASSSEDASWRAFRRLWNTATERGPVTWSSVT